MRPWKCLRHNSNKKNNHNNKYLIYYEIQTEHYPFIGKSNL